MREELSPISIKITRPSARDSLAEAEARVGCDFSGGCESEVVWRIDSSFGFGELEQPFDRGCLILTKCACADHFGHVFNKVLADFTKHVVD